MFGEDITAYLPEHIKPFKEQLRQFPQNYEKWVYATSLPTKTYQGDVSTGVPFSQIEDNGEAVRFESLGMVISNTCDVQPDQSDSLLVAPVIDLEDYRQRSQLKGEALESHIRDLKENKLSQLLFLPTASGFAMSFVDFGNIASVSPKFFYSGRGQKRLASLSQCGHYFLLIKLAYHFCRPEAQDAKRQ